MAYLTRAPALAVALILVATSGFADTVGVSRCTQSIDGVFRPGLLTVEEDGTRTFHLVGENGLTEDIVYSREAAFGWVADQGLFPEGTVFNDYVGFNCGNPCEDCIDEPEPEEPEQQQEPEEETDTPTDG